MTAGSTAFADVLKAIESPKGLTSELARGAFDAVLSGAWNPAQIAGLLVALRLRGEDPNVIVAAAESMRSAMLPVQHHFERVIDTCGTGGDGQGTINLSTAAAIVVAASGLIVAKHGNRAVSSRSGSADVLERLGVVLSLAPQSNAKILNEVGICFMLAPTHHPAMRHAMPIRRELGIRTIFNCLGPLANPARATHQLLGAFSDEIRPVLANTLKQLGTQRAWVVFGSDGLDEMSPFATTRVTEVSPTALTELEIAPEDFGIPRSPPGAIAGGESADNARALESILKGEPHPATDAVVLNAAAALVVADGLEPKNAAHRARELLANGAAHRKLAEWISATVAANTPAAG